MQTTFAIAALASVASAAIGSSPSSPAPAGCSASYANPFQITIINATTTVAKRASSTCGQAGYLTATLNDGILKDSEGRQGEIVANYQFQFDADLQPNAIYTEGFSVCNNGSLALGGSNVFWQCTTTGGPGIGTYSNLYTQSIASYCEPILIDVLPCPATSTASAVSQVSDGQPEATGTAGVVSQISDGQVQATGTAGVPVSQISDGQIQATTMAAACIVSQISDGQLQMTMCTAAPVSQISDGQIQATTAAGGPVSQISDGQIQATTFASVTGAPVSQISDGQIQATATASSARNSTASVTPLVVTAGAVGHSMGGFISSVVIGLAGMILL